MKKVFTIFLFIFVSASIYAAADTQGYYSTVISFEVRTDINSVLQTVSSSETTNILIELSKTNNYDSIGIYVNETLIDTIVIVQGVNQYIFPINTKNYSVSDSVNIYIVGIEQPTRSYSVLLLDAKGYYSPVISFQVNTGSSFIFDLTEYVSDYSRFKKLTELYPQLSDYYFGSYEYWYNLALLENDVYYRQPNLEYLKFKRLADKYK